MQNDPKSAVPAPASGADDSEHASVNRLQRVGGRLGAFGLLAFLLCASPEKALSAGTLASSANLPAPHTLNTNRAPTYYLGAITRGPTNRKRIALCFTAHEYAEGAEVILKTLREHKGKASFFLTGVFLANTNYSPLVHGLLREGHYVGPHSDQHLLYCGWEKSRPTLVTKEAFKEDLSKNLEKIVLHRKDAAVSQTPESILYFLPPFEHYNQEVANWTSEAGMVLINFTQGTRSNADYTGEADKNFVSSETIYKSIVDYEARDPNGMNGFILLLHLGAGPGRADKFHARFPQLLEHFSAQGYEFVSVETLLK